MSTPTELTHPTPADSNGVPPHFLVIVPGFLGSKLRDKTTGETIWVDLEPLVRNVLGGGDALEYVLKHLAYPNPNLEPAGILDELLLLGTWKIGEKYDRLWAALAQMGYRADAQKYSEDERNAYAFAYDFRQDNRISARELKAAIERWSVFHPGARPWIIAHSNGGVVARWYIENEGGKQKVGRLFLMASPWDGTPKSIRMLHDGFELLGRRLSELVRLPERTRELLLTFPSLYQLIPHQNAFLRRASHEPLDVFADAQWLPSPAQRELLADGQRFNAELSRDTSVETTCFFGRSKPTLAEGIVSLTQGGAWQTITWLATDTGDGTLPEQSAIHPHAQQKYPFACGHDVYAYPPALEILRWELLDKYRDEAPDRAALATTHLTVLFEPERDVYNPGDPIRVWATVTANATQAPLGDAQIQVDLLWRQPLPGDSTPASGPRAQVSHTAAGRILLAESDTVPGRYEGNLSAPAAEGYYDLRAVVQLVGEPTLELRELLSVDAGAAAERTI